MPNIEAMCEQGVVFENSYSAPVCSPTRSTIMTGQYGFRTGVGSAIPKEGTNGLSADTTSLFDVLDNSGYSSNLLGKWHLASNGESLDHPARLGVPDFLVFLKVVSVTTTYGMLLIKTEKPLRSKTTQLRKLPTKHLIGSRNKKSHGFYG